MNFKPIINSIKKFKSLIILSVIIIGISIPVIVKTVIASKNPILFSVGSSAVKPILEKIANVYQNKINSNFDLIIDAGGSSTGIESIAYGYTQIGNTSRNPKPNEVGYVGENKGRYNENWISNNLKTITLGWDGIAIIYKQPKNATNELNINKDNIWKLYQVMTGYYDGQVMTLNDLTPNAGDVQIFAYPRSGGAFKSGTADAFANDSNLCQPSNAPTNKEEIQNALKNGQYNFKKGNVIVTNESNAETWLKVLNDNKDGAITYLSTGFVLNNLDEILKSGFKIALYNNNKLSYESIALDYMWVRPINNIISIKNNLIIDNYFPFLEWYFKSQIAIQFPKNPRLQDGKENFISKQDFADIGIKPLTLEQIKSMAVEEENNQWNFWIDDYSLNNKNFKQGNLHFGATL